MNYLDLLEPSFLVDLYDVLMKNPTSSGSFYILELFQHLNQMVFLFTSSLAHLEKIILLFTALFGNYE